MIEIIKEIPGLIFLIVYILVTFLVIFFAKKYAESDYTKDLEMPEPSKVSPLDIALLQKGIKGAVIVSVFNLWRNKKIDIREVKNNLTLKQMSSDFNGLNRLERAILKNSSSQKYYRFFFTKKSVKTLQNILKPNKENLENLKLLPDNMVRKRYWNISLLSLVSLLLFGGTKFFLGVSRDKPVVFLFILILLSVIAVFYYIKPYGIKYSALGKKFISASSQRFSWLKEGDRNSVMADDNLLYGVALFGISSFMGAAYSDFLESPLLLETKAGSSYGYGCGGAGCGGAGCTGGGGCGGGGGCSGGCGGCGGD